MSSNLEDLLREDLPLGETAGSINEFATVGDFGFLRVEGPFTYHKEGTVWAVVVETDGLNPFTKEMLLDSAGDGAVAVADAEIIAGGVVIDCIEVDAWNELHLVVDQYKMGSEEAE